MKHKRRYEAPRFVVKWIVGNTMYFRPYKRDRYAVAFQDFLIEHEKIPPKNIRIVMIR